MRVFFQPFMRSLFLRGDPNKNLKRFPFLVDNGRNESVLDGETCDEGCGPAQWGAQEMAVWPHTESPQSRRSLSFSPIIMAADRPAPVCGSLPFPAGTPRKSLKIFRFVSYFLFFCETLFF